MIMLQQFYICLYSIAKIVTLLYFAIIDELPPGTETVQIKTEAGETQAFYMPSSKRAKAPLLVFFHANAEKATQWLHQLQYVYGSTGVHILVVEYRGYHHSDGQPTQHSLTKDSCKLIDLILERPECDGLLLHGRSIGV